MPSCTSREALASLVDSCQILCLLVRRVPAANLHEKRIVSGSIEVSTAVHIIRISYICIRIATPLDRGPEINSGAVQIQMIRVIVFVAVIRAPYRQQPEI